MFDQFCVFLLNFNRIWGPFDPVGHRKLHSATGNALALHAPAGAAEPLEPPQANGAAGAGGAVPAEFWNVPNFGL